jgi:hypothetical protein
MSFAAGVMPGRGSGSCASRRAPRRTSPPGARRVIQWAARSFADRSARSGRPPVTAAEADRILEVARILDLPPLEAAASAPRRRPGAHPGAPLRRGLRRGGEPGHSCREKTPRGAEGGGHEGALPQDLAGAGERDFPGRGAASSRYPPGQQGERPAGRGAGDAPRSRGAGAEDPGARREHRGGPARRGRLRVGADRGDLLHAPGVVPGAPRSLRPAVGSEPGAQGHPGAAGPGAPGRQRALALGPRSVPGDHPDPADDLHLSGGSDQLTGAVPGAARPVPEGDPEGPRGGGGSPRSTATRSGSSPTRSCRPPPPP